MKFDELFNTLMEANITEALYGDEKSEYLTDEEEREFVELANRALIGVQNPDEFDDIAQKYYQMRQDKIAARKREHMERLSKKFVGEQTGPYDDGDGRDERCDWVPCGNREKKKQKKKKNNKK